MGDPRAGSHAARRRRPRRQKPRERAGSRRKEAVVRPRTSASLLFQSHKFVFSIGRNPREAATAGKPAYGDTWPSAGQAGPETDTGGEGGQGVHTHIPRRMRVWRGAAASPAMPAATAVLPWKYRRGGAQRCPLEPRALRKLARFKRRGTQPADARPRHPPRAAERRCTARLLACPPGVGWMNGAFFDRSHVLKSLVRTSSTVCPPRMA